MRSHSAPEHRSVLLAESPSQGAELLELRVNFLYLVHCGARDVGASGEPEGDCLPDLAGIQLLELGGEGDGDASAGLPAAKMQQLREEARLAGGDGAVRGDRNKELNVVAAPRDSLRVEGPDIGTGASAKVRLLSRHAKQLKVAPSRLPRWHRW